MIEQLLLSVQDNDYWKRAFSRLTYEAAFRSYCSQYQPLFRTALESTDAEKLAEELLDGLEAGWKRQKLFARGKVQADEKFMVVTYFSPMLLAAGEPECSRLANALRELWCRRRKGDPYEVADYDTIKKGFKNRIFGIEIGKKDK